MKITMNETILEEAQRLVSEDKAEDYGDVFNMHASIAHGWSVLLGVQIGARDVALMMIWMKTCRAKHDHKRDTIVDIAGYARCIELIGKRQEELVADTPEVREPEENVEDGSDTEVTTSKSQSAISRLLGRHGSTS